MRSLVIICSRGICQPPLYSICLADAGKNTVEKIYISPWCFFFNFRNVCYFSVLKIWHGNCLIKPEAKQAGNQVTTLRRIEMKKTLLSMAIAASFGLASASASAVVFNDFRVDPNYDGNTANAFTADKVTGNYVESIIFYDNDTFDVRLRWVAGQFAADDGTRTLLPVITGLGSTYGLYALYEGKGTYSTDAAGVTTFRTTPGVGSLSLYLDPFVAITDFAVNGDSINYGNIFNLINNADDKLVATGIPQEGSGTLNPALCAAGGINCGSFGTSTTFLLEPFGKEFFFDPNPFFNFSFQSGQLNNFAPQDEQLINGSMDVVFHNVPEPASLALLGLGLVGLGMSRRRKAS